VVGTQWWAHSGGQWLRDMCNTGTYLRRGPSCTTIENLYTTVAQQMAIECLGEVAPYSNSHKSMLQARRERPRAVPGASPPVWCWALDKWGLWSHLGPLPLSPLFSILRLKLSEAVFGGSFLTHTYFILLARVLQKQSGSLKNLIVTGTLCLQ